MYFCPSNTKIPMLNGTQEIAHASTYTFYKLDSINLMLTLRNVGIFGIAIPKQIQDSFVMLI